MVEGSSRVLVTGSKGFIGQRLVERLQSSGQEVVEFDSKINPAHDISSIDAVNEALDGCSAAFNLAARLGTEIATDGPGFVSVNVLGAANLFEAATNQGIPVVQASKPNIWPNFYTVTKTAAEGIAHVYNRERGGKIQIVRMFNLYGPGQAHGEGHPRKFAPSFINSAIRDEPLEIYGSGEQGGDFTYVDDAVMALIKASQVEVPTDEPIEIGTGDLITVNQIAQMIISLANSSSTITHLPMRPGEVETAQTPVAHTDQMHEVLGFHPPTSLEEGLTTTINYYRQLKDSN